MPAVPSPTLFLCPVPPLLGGFHYGSNCTLCRIVAIVCDALLPPSSTNTFDRLLTHGSLCQLPPLLIVTLHKTPRRQQHSIPLRFDITGIFIFHSSLIAHPSCLDIVARCNMPNSVREIVHLQTGQCGNQIGARFWYVE